MKPLMIDLEKKTVIIFGGGGVGARKAAFFCREADVRVLSRSFVPEFSGMNVECNEIDLSDLSDTTLLSLLKGAFLAVAATQDENLNNRIGMCCRKAGILFNNAQGESGDLIIPSVIRGEHYILAISTEGASPAISRYIREFMEKSCPHLDDMISLQIRLRSFLKEHQPHVQRRKELIWEVLCDTDVWDALSSGQQEAWDVIEARYL
ncbi:MAG TPA: bifunctional precorrin-2 dehydrogenase/sirohydrochlorin ferrochelatase [Methanoregulaceae archaeon]|nr:bifunctional precorrin-2 dehydrogenase/sirohydrochlorin ferrochelatase [Methanoregulaceae archaeon]